MFWKMTFSVFDSRVEIMADCFNSSAFGFFSCSLFMSSVMSCISSLSLADWQYLQIWGPFSFVLLALGSYHVKWTKTMEVNPPSQIFLKLNKHIELFMLIPRFRKVYTIQNEELSKRLKYVVDKQSKIMKLLKIVYNCLDMAVTSLMYHCKYINKCICFCKSLLLGHKCVQFKLFSLIPQYLDDIRLVTTIFG